ncbi:hypothetical protein CTAYLR_010786 [Chrysophaeum taylorii]|uniref:Matrin-type domain-containing protein n=1 Tax=Chrysophaeum taylorii TaxID=2483200 RepID=A0AAD7UH29_9STRA|nr:hypothetical protein CTAYLR_010786 [Chrysophaeum taylorii]
MQQLFVRLPWARTAVVLLRDDSKEEEEEEEEDLSREIFDRCVGGDAAALARWRSGTRLRTRGQRAVAEIRDGDEIEVKVVGVGGIDFQNRVGSKPGSGGVQSSEQANIDRRERLRKLALETVDLNKDPYFMRNHLGTFECKLCLTLHNTEGNYLAHTQGKRHQQNLARRAFKESTAPIAPTTKTYVEKRHTIKIGRPGYKVTKSRDLGTKHRMLLFEIDYPEAADDVQPRHRFMSAYEQRVEPPDKRYQYLLFACDPYETIAFKIPNHDIDKDPEHFFSNWDPVSKKFTLSLMFADTQPANSNASSATASGPTKHRATLTYDTRY